VTVAAVVLAAGASSRYGVTPPKQAVFLPRVLAALRGLDVVVVTGAHPLEPDGVRVVQCGDWERGPGASLRCGLAALGDEVDAALVVLADGPELDRRAVDRVIEAWQGEDAVAASYDGLRLHPVLLARAAWSRVPDEGARGIEARLVACDDLPPPGDVDTQEA
jgi:CTP:molybdopterin cytidylyltransferase MocA